PFPTTCFCHFGFLFYFSTCSTLLHYSQDQNGRQRASRTRQATGSHRQQTTTNRRKSVAARLQTTEISKCYDPMDAHDAWSDRWRRVVVREWWATVGGQPLVGDRWWATVGRRRLLGDGCW